MSHFLAQSNYYSSFFYVQSLHCDIRIFAHGAMGCWIDPSWWTHGLSDGAISRSSQCSTTGITKAV